MLVIFVISISKLIDPEVRFKSSYLRLGRVGLLVIRFIGIIVFLTQIFAGENEIPVTVRGPQGA